MSERLISRSDVMWNDVCSVFGCYLTENAGCNTTLTVLVVIFLLYKVLKVQL